MKHIARHTARSYSAQAHEYELKWKAYLNHTHQRLIEQLAVEKGDRICDQSCGTGLFTYRLLNLEQTIGEIRLNDLSTRMLQIAKDRFASDDRVSFSNVPSAHIHESISLLDILLSVNAFHNYVSQATVLQSSFEALKSGGDYYILDWNREGVFKLINFLIKLFVKDHIDSRSAVEMEKMLGQTGFEVVFVKKWRWRYWAFYLIKAHKPST